MADYMSVVADAGEQALDATKKVQSSVISAVSQVSETVADYVPDLKGVLPFLDRLPAPKDLATAYFDFAGKFLDAQRDYTMALIDAMSPVTEKILPKPKARKTTPKSSTKRAA
jgi:hypothetical protein